MAKVTLSSILEGNIPSKSMASYTSLYNLLNIVQPVLYNPSSQ